MAGDPRKGSVRPYGEDQGLKSGRCGYNPRAMSEPSRSNMSNVIQVLQLVALMLGVLGLFTFVGKRDQQLTQVSTDLDKLVGAVNDLAKAQASTAISDAMQERALEDIQRRLNNLERSNK